MKKNDSIFDKEMSKEIFDAYVLSKLKPDAMDFYKFLVDMSARTNKEISYLRAMKDYYFSNLASEDEKKLCHSVTKCNNKFLGFCGTLLSLSPDKRIDFLVKSNVRISDLRDYFDSYKKYFKGSDVLLDNILEEYICYLEDSKVKLREERKLINYNKACSFYQNLIDLGFYSIGNYSDFYGYNRRKISLLHKRYREFINEIDPYKYLEYMNLFEVNREKTFYFVKDKIDRFNSDLREAFLNGKNYDIIDYYLTVGVPLTSFKELCSGFITRGEMCNFNKFSGKYISLEYSKFDEKYVLSSFNRINDREISDSEKAQVYSFLKENDIPIVYYNIALFKYVNGELDNYIGGFIKTKNSSN